MKTCEKCLHKNLCDDWAYRTGIPFVNPISCLFFTDKENVFVVKVLDDVKKAFLDLEYESNTDRKKIDIDLHNDICNWILKEICISVVDEIQGKYIY